MATASKNIVAELNKGEKLNGDNYNIWAMKIQYVVEEQEALEVLNQIMQEPNEPEEGNTIQYRQNLEAYAAWKKNCMTHITLLSSMENDIMREFSHFITIKDMCEALQARFGGTSTTILRQLTICFDTYKMPQGQSMKVYLRNMANMISELRDTGHEMTNE